MRLDLGGSTIQNTADVKKGFVPVCLATISGSIAIAYGAVEPILPYCNTACVSAGGSGAKDFHYVPPQSKGSFLFQHVMV